MGQLGFIVTTRRQRKRIFMLTSAAYDAPGLPSRHRAAQNKPGQKPAVERPNPAAEGQAPAAATQQRGAKPSCAEERSTNIQEHSGEPGRRSDDDPALDRRSSGMQTGNPQRGDAERNS
jgi:hypothetical protein